MIHISCAFATSLSTPDHVAVAEDGEEGTQRRLDQDPVGDVADATAYPVAEGGQKARVVTETLACIGIDTGIDLDQLIDAGAFISEHLGRPTQSRVAKAVLAKRASSAVCEAV